MYLIYFKNDKSKSSTSKEFPIVEFEPEDHVQILGIGGVLVAEKKPEDKEIIKVA